MLLKLPGRKRVDAAEGAGGLADVKVKALTAWMSREFKTSFLVSDKLKPGAGFVGGFTDTAL